MLQVQVQRVGGGSWHVTRVTELQHRVYQYDVIARVVEDDGLYYVELAHWENGKEAWLRRPRGYQLLRGALKHASDHALGKVEGS